MAFCKAGHIYIVDTVLTKPPKEKFAICICVNPDYFLWINSESRSHGQDQLPLKEGSHRLITHDSYLDLSRIVAHSAAELEDAREFERISQTFARQIVHAIDAGLEVLPDRHAQMIRKTMIMLLEN